MSYTATSLYMLGYGSGPIAREFCSVICDTLITKPIECTKECWEAAQSPEVLTELVSQASENLVPTDPNLTAHIATLRAYFISRHLFSMKNVVPYYEVSLIAEVFQSLKPLLSALCSECIVFCSGSIGLSTCSIALQEVDCSRFIRKLALANLAIIPSFQVLSGSWKTSLVGALALTSTVVLVRLLKGYCSGTADHDPLIHRHPSPKGKSRQFLFNTEGRLRPTFDQDPEDIRSALAWAIDKHFPHRRDDAPNSALMVKISEFIVRRLRANQ